MNASPKNQYSLHNNDRHNDSRDNRYRDNDRYPDRTDWNGPNRRPNSPNDWQEAPRQHNRSRNNNYQKPGNNRQRPKRGAAAEPKCNKIYFIALLPNAAVGKEVIRLKQEFSREYGPVAALKAMPHITIQVPFTAHPRLERELSLALAAFAAGRQPFDVELNGFGFLPQPDRRSIYINVEKTPPITDLHLQLIYFLRKEFGFSEMLARKGFTPHITLGFKDVTEDQFADAWPDYESRPFNATFRVNNIYLLRHNGLSWEVLQKCPMGANKA